MTTVTLPPLTKGEQRVLDALTCTPDIVVRWDELARRTYGYDGDHAVAALRPLISRIRRKLGPEAISTVRGVGVALGPLHQCEACGGMGVIAARA